MGRQEHQLAQLLLVWIRANSLLPCVLWSLLHFSLSFLGPVAFYIQVTKGIDVNQCGAGAAGQSCSMVQEAALQRSL